MDTKLLKQAQLTQKQLASLLGVHVNTVSHWTNSTPEYVTAYLELRIRWIELVKYKQRVTLALAEEDIEDHI